MTAVLIKGPELRALRTVERSCEHPSGPRSAPANSFDHPDRVIAFLGEELHTRKARRALLVSAGAAALMALGATEAHASIAQFDWHATGAAPGFRSRTWHATGANSMNVYKCQTVEQAGDVTVRLRKERDLQPDQTVGSLKWWCSQNSSHCQHFPSTSGGDFHWDISHGPGGCITSPNGECPVTMNGRNYYSSN
jgi:hypothetical protein